MSGPTGSWKLSSTTVSYSRSQVWTHRQLEAIFYNSVIQQVPGLDPQAAGSYLLQQCHTAGPRSGPTGSWKLSSTTVSYSRSQVWTHRQLEAIFYKGVIQRGPDVSMHSWLVYHTVEGASGLPLMPSLCSPLGVSVSESEIRQGHGGW